MLLVKPFFIKGWKPVRLIDVIVAPEEDEEDDKDDWEDEKDVDDDTDDGAGGGNGGVGLFDWIMLIL